MRTPIFISRITRLKLAALTITALVLPLTIALAHMAGRAVAT